ncbi:class I SAM-dependent methyltransferase, partial [Candidatus Gottesmanbacteria bacterium]|nr:class I SAM-dependent methyltransferase [Candidatus Gottesmanbacteria bacterium]
MRGEYSDFVHRYYQRGYFTGDRSRVAYVNYEGDKAYITANLRKFFSFLRLYKPTGKLLDVGCALGFSTELAQQVGYDAYGIDPSDYAVGKAKKLVGIDRIRKAKLSDARDRSKTYDIVAMFDVFEHLADPARDLATVKKILKDDGVIIIATGDTDSLMARMLGRRWTFYNPPQHLYYFNRHNLTKLLEQKGFEPVAWT